MNSSLTVQDLGDKFQINTGKIRFNVKKQNFNLLDEVWVDESGNQNYSAANRIVAPHSRGLVHYFGSGEFLSSNDNSPTVIVERQGPGAVLITARGVLKRSTGDSTFHFISRIYAFNNSQTIKMTNTIENWLPLSNAQIGLLGLHAEIPLDLGATKNAVVGKPGGFEQASLSAGQEAYCLAQRTSGSLISIDGKLGGAVSGSFYPKSVKPRDFGWASLSDGTRGCAVGMRYFWEMFPSSIEAKADGMLSAGIYAKRTGLTLPIYSGVSRSCDTRWTFFNTASADAQRQRVAGAIDPLFAVAPPYWYCRRTHALGPLAEKNASIYNPTDWTFIQAVDQQVDNNWTRCYNAVDSRFSTDAYGFLEWGDGLHYTWGPITNPWNLAWDGNYYGLDHMAFIHFLRTGSMTSLDFALAHARHVEDIHEVHLGPGHGNNGANRYCPATNHIAGDQATTPHVEVHTSHFKVQGCFERFYLTGAERALETGIEGCDWLGHFNWSMSMGNNLFVGRRPAHLIKSLCYAYAHTKDEKYHTQIYQNWFMIKKAANDTPGPIIKDWHRGMVYEALTDVYHIYHGDDRDSIPFYMMIQANKASMDVDINASLGYAFLGSKYGPTHLNRARSLMSNLRATYSNLFKDFAERGQNVERAMYYFAIPESLAIADVTPVDPSAGILPKQTDISAYPNPFYPAITLRVQCKLQNAKCKVQIFNIHGQMIESTIAKGNVLTWMPKHNPAGVYMVKCKVGNKILQKKIHYLK
jgi:hypothetical protein